MNNLKKLSNGFTELVPGMRAKSANSRLNTEYYDLIGQIAAINAVQAVIEFELDGIIINANSNFLEVMGYELDEIVGQHHSMFVDQSTKASDAYREFWKKIGLGETQSGEFSPTLTTIFVMLQLLM